MSIHLCLLDTLEPSASLWDELAQLEYSIAELLWSLVCLCSQVLVMGSESVSDILRVEGNWGILLGKHGHQFLVRESNTLSAPTRFAIESLPRLKPPVAGRMNEPAPWGQQPNHPAWHPSNPFPFHPLPSAQRKWKVSSYSIWNGALASALSLHGFFFEFSLTNCFQLPSRAGHHHNKIQCLPRVSAATWGFNVLNECYLAEPVVNQRQMACWLFSAPVVLGWVAFRPTGSLFCVTSLFHIYGLLLLLFQASGCQLCGTEAIFLLRWVKLEKANKYGFYSYSML